MKIGEFSKQFNVPIATVRHYINLGLLVPEKNGFQYDFTEDDCREMEIITSMKNVGFKLSELNKYLNIFRFYNTDDYLLYEKLLEFLNTKKESLYAERNQINSHIRLINKEIKETERSCAHAMSRSGSATTPLPSNDHLPGVPLNAVNLLSCPHCQSKINLSNVTIAGDSIINGDLVCKCGYRATIRNGIIFTPNTVDLENDPKFLECYFGEENLICNEDGMFLMGMNDYSAQYLTIMHKASLWIHKELEQFDFNGKTLLFPDVSCQYLYSHYQDEKIEDSIFLITALSERTIRTMRRHIANVNPNLKVVYIINQDGQLPLKHNCIDAVIDYLGSTNLGFFYGEHYFDMITPYLSDDALSVGIIEYYDRDCSSLKNVHKNYLNAAKNVLTLEFATEAFAANGFQIEKSEQPSELQEPGKFFEYHAPGDKRYNMVYLARRKNR